MGTVLHLASRDREHRALIRFSPLLDGDGVASAPNIWNGIGLCLVSVPFSMGTVLHRLESTTRLWAVWGFSPLLDGDGVASCEPGWGRQVHSLRFSPLLDGDGVASHSSRAVRHLCYWVSVPFSMGTVLHLSQLRPAEVD